MTPLDAIADALAPYYDAEHARDRAAAVVNALDGWEPDDDLLADLTETCALYLDPRAHDPARVARLALRAYIRHLRPSADEIDLDLMLVAFGVAPRDALGCGSGARG